jgi:hypothetical protein
MQRSNADNLNCREHRRLGRLETLWLGSCLAGLSLFLQFRTQPHLGCCLAAAAAAASAIFCGCLLEPPRARSNFQLAMHKQAYGVLFVRAHIWKPCGAVAKT